MRSGLKTRTSSLSSRFDRPLIARFENWGKPRSRRPHTLAGGFLPRTPVPYSPIRVTLPTSACAIWCCAVSGLVVGIKTLELGQTIRWLSAHTAPTGVADTPGDCSARLPTTWPAPLAGRSRSTHCDGRSIPAVRVEDERVQDSPTRADVEADHVLSVHQLAGHGERRRRSD